MRLICVNELENTDQFSTGLRELFAIMAYRNDKQGMKQFLEEHKEYQQLDEETANVIGAMIGVRTFMDNKNQYEEEGTYNMCQAIREMWEDGVNEGIESSTLQSIKNLTETLALTIHQAMAALKIPASEQEKYMQMLLK